MTRGVTDYTPCSVAGHLFSPVSPNYGAYVCAGTKQRARDWEERKRTVTREEGRINGDKRGRRERVVGVDQRNGRL